MKIRLHGIQPLLVACAVCAAAVGTAKAQGTLYYRADLDGADVVPPVDTPAFGGALIELNGSTATIRAVLQVLWFDPTGAFVRGPALAGEEGPVIFDLGPRAVTPGPNGSLNFQWKQIYELTSVQMDQLASGQWYAEMTSSAYPEGEIRGQFTFYAVPEPNTVLLLAVGVVAVGVTVWRRKGSHNRPYRI